MPVVADSATKGENTARAPNYSQERKERDRQKAAKKAEKALAKAAKTERAPKEEGAVRSRKPNSQSGSGSGGDRHACLAGNGEKARAPP